jgi:hypothetical protein
VTFGTTLVIIQLTSRIKESRNKSIKKFQFTYQTTRLYAVILLIDLPRNNMAIGVRVLDKTDSCVWRSSPCTCIYEAKGDVPRWDDIVTSLTNVLCLGFISQPRAPGCIICNNVTAIVGLLNIIYCPQMKRKGTSTSCACFRSVRLWIPSGPTTEDACCWREDL